MLAALLISWTNIQFSWEVFEKYCHYCCDCGYIAVILRDILTKGFNVLGNDYWGLQWIVDLGYQSKLFNRHVALCHTIVDSVYQRLHNIVFYYLNKWLLALTLEITSNQMLVYCYKLGWVWSSQFNLSNWLSLDLVSTISIDSWLFVKLLNFCNVG